MGTGEAADEDPGWPWRKLPSVFVPFALQRRMREPQNDVLEQLRLVFGSFCSAIALFGVILLFLVPWRTESNDGAAVIWVATIVVLSAIVQVILGVVERPLPCDAAAAYRARFFVRIAVSEAAALFGFVATFLVNSAWVYFIPMLVAYAGFAHAAPTRRNLRRDQAELDRQGCNKSLVRMLRGLDADPG